MIQQRNPAAPIRRRAFTLIELLVVVAIIALLVAILLPSLAGARRLAQTSVCAANLRSVSQVMNMYASEWDGSILGSGNTTARNTFNSTFTAWSGTVGINTNCPNVLATFDWMSPTLLTMNTYFDPGGTLTSRLGRFTQEINYKLFKCPSYTIPGTVYPMGNDGLALPSVVGLPSYCTSTLFQMNASGNGVQYETWTDDVTLPGSYTPKIGFVGQPSAKIFIADGAKYSSTATQPDLNMVSHATDLASSWTDEGAYTTYTRSWDRGLAPGNNNFNGGTVDARVYGYRHGSQTQKGPTGAYKMNAAFFDGHAELITDKDSADPGYWSPSGTFMSNAHAAPQTDTKTLYFTGPGTSFTSP